jgi:hypothetical protein
MNLPNKFRRISDQIYAGAAPSSEQIKDMQHRFGLKAVLSLDNEAGLKIAPTLASLNIKHFFYPINPEESIIGSNLKFLAKNLTQILINQPIYIHCLAGRDRTGLIQAIYRIKKQNWQVDKALSEVKQYGYGNGVSVKTQNLWNNLLIGLQSNVNFLDDNSIEDEKDLVTIVRDFQDLSLPPAFINQQSWAPLGSQPEYNSSINLEQAEIPLVGIYSNIGPDKGAGPVDNSGILNFIY